MSAVHKPISHLTDNVGISRYNWATGVKRAPLCGPRISPIVGLSIIALQINGSAHMLVQMHIKLNKFRLGHGVSIRKSP